MRLITVMSDRAEDVVIRSEPQRQRTHRVSSLEELRPILEKLPDAEDATILDLSGHSTRDGKLLRLGATVIDMCRPSVARFFQALAESGELERLGIVTLRLLGCETAIEPVGQLTIKLLSSTLGMPVFGTRRSLMGSHYNDQGFHPCFSSVLVEAAQLPSPPRRLS